MNRKEIMIAAAFFMILPAATAQTLSVDDVSVGAGQKATVSICLNGISSGIAAGFSIVLPSQAFGDYELVLGERYANGHVAQSCLHGNNTLKVAVYSPFNVVVSDGWVTGNGGTSSGNITMLSVKFDTSNLPAGIYDGRVKNVEVAYLGNQLVQLADATFQIEVRDIPTIINEKPVEKNYDDAWYDLSGRKYTEKPTSKGIYIRNGKKIIIK